MVSPIPTRPSFAIASVAKPVAAPPHAVSSPLDAQWQAHEEHLLAFATRLAGTPDEGKELAQKAYIAICRGEREWHRETASSFFAFACRIVRSIHSHDWSSAEARHEVAFVQERDDVDPSSLGNPEQLVAKKEELDARIALLGALSRELTGDATCSAVLALYRQDVIEPVYQAERLQLPVQAVYDAHDRIHYAAKRLMRERA